MSKSESVQKRLTKVRPPRVQMSYDVEIGDAIESKELPFVMGVVGDFGGNSEVEQKRLKERKFVGIDRDNFDEVMKGVEPRAAYRVANELGENGGQFAVDLKFKSMEDFRPESVVQHMAGLVDGIDVASGGELRVALDTTMAPRNISFAGPGKSDADLACAVAAGIVLNMESAGEMERIAAIGLRLGVRPQVAVRVNPDFELKSSGMRMGGGPKQFGVDAEQVPELLARLGQLALDFHGFHIFSGSQNLKAEAIQEAHEKTFALALRLAEHAPRPLRMLNIGGGFGIPYFPGEGRLDLAAVGENLKRLLPGVKRALPEAHIVIELGRYLVGEAGVYVSKVIERKVSRGQVYLVTDGG
eukprot:gene46255-57683_t